MSEPPPSSEPPFGDAAGTADAEVRRLDAEAHRLRVEVSDLRRRLIVEQEQRALLALQLHRRGRSAGGSSASPAGAEARTEVAAPSRLPHLLPAPRVSIVMPVFNGGPYFELALQSALAQTYDDLEIVVVNDGSTDGGATDAIASRYAARRPERVRYLRQENTGVSGALNAGIRHMTGDIFCWLSHDDLFVPEKTAVQADAWRRIGRRDAILFSDYGVIDRDGELIVAGAFEHALFMAAPRLPLYRGGVNGCTVFIPAALLRTRAEPFDTRLRFAGDYKLWAELLEEREFLHVPRSLVLSRRHPGQDSHRPDVAGEGEALWRGLVDGLSEVQMAQLYGSAWRFFDETHRILSRSPNQETAAYLAHRRAACLEDTLVSVILRHRGEAGAAQTLESVLRQSHRRLEVIPVADGPGRPLASDDPRVRGGQARGPGSLDLIGARGAYLALIEAGTVWPADRLAGQLAAMAKAGALLSRTEAEGAARRSPAPTDDLLRSSTVMLHRLLLGEGFRLSGDPDHEAAEWRRVSERHGVLTIGATPA